jgi:hypothetical protein
MVIDVVRLDVTDPASLAEFAAALRIAEADEFGHVMTIGEHHLGIDPEQVAHDRQPPRRMRKGHARPVVSHQHSLLDVGSVMLTRY